MKIGIPKEIKSKEYRVGMIPSGVRSLVEAGHQVYIEKDAGEKSGFFDSDYQQAGGFILDDPKEIFSICEMIVKVKEPQQEEYDSLKPGQILFTYLHLAPNKKLTEILLEKKVTALGYETVQDNGRLPLLSPMSQIAGRVAPMVASYFLSMHNKGMGVLISGSTGILPSKVLIIGSGNVAKNAAKIASGMGADVIVMGRNLQSMRSIEASMGSNVSTLYSNAYNMEKILPIVDIVICAVYVTGEKTPQLITRKMLSYCKKGTVLVDVAIDQGGCIETSRPTTHDEPVFEVDGVLHYCVANIPGDYPLTATEALANATIPYVKKIADLGWKNACLEDTVIYSGVNVAGGFVTDEAVANAHQMDYQMLKDIMYDCPEFGDTL
ncbi:alanine dehydrogenase [Sulfurovum sp. XGS-02]|uniref:alanine dehydrogenase n=1 Tax=Sulfurovum sp. XGS-02 TaxID=2925411 RepID=UPI00206F9EE4|nr:alanine dehydrogenase [Sulfurovum sp. XGS-02]UPT76609.1 alanine dehydrogenase [Sulfurovum sp. XGS-02]